MKSILIAALLSCTLQANATHYLNLAWGRILLVDFGSLIKSEPVIQNENLVRVYSLSGLADENQKSIIAIQGLSESGSTDISIDTEAGIEQINIKLGNILSEDLILKTKTRSCIITTPFQSDIHRSIIVESDSPINEYVLASRPELLELKHLSQPNDPKYLRSFVLNTSTKGLTDLVIATQRRVYKLSINIGGHHNEPKHTERIKLDANSCQR